MSEVMMGAAVATAVATFITAIVVSLSAWNDFKARKLREADLYEKHLVSWAGGWRPEGWLEAGLAGKKYAPKHDSTGREIEITGVSITLHGIAVEFDTNGKSNIAWGMRSHEKDGGLVFWLRTRKRENGALRITMRKRPALSPWEKREKAYVRIRRNAATVWTVKLEKIHEADMNPRSGGFHARD